MSIENKKSLVDDDYEEEEDDSSSAEEHDNAKDNTVDKIAEERKKQKLRERKKLKRKRRRQREAIQKKAQENEENDKSTNGEQDDNEGETPNEHNDKADAQATEEGPPKKKVYGVCLDPEDYPHHDEIPTNYDPTPLRFRRSDEPEQEEAPQPTKQHRGLRCKKCFSLLCRDLDFEYRNGQIWVDSDLVKKIGWGGLIVQGTRVYCEKMHIVGAKRAATWTNKTKYMLVIKVDHTTFIENFLKNPDFAGSELIKNRLNFSEPSNDGMWIKLSLPNRKFVPEPRPTDRYHPEQTLDYIKK
jgi:hypothetical protein